MKYEPPAMPVEVEKLHMEVDGSMKVLDLKLQVRSKIPDKYVPIAFFWKGKTLSDGNGGEYTLEMYNINDNSTIVVLVEDKPAEATSIKGGKRNKKSNRQRKSKKNRNSRRKF